MSDLAKLLADNLRRFREKRDCTQEALAENADVSLDMIQKIEGKKSWPRLKMLRKIAKGLGIDETILFQTEKPALPVTQRQMADVIESLQNENDKKDQLIESLRRDIRKHEYVLSGLERIARIKGSQLAQAREAAESKIEAERAIDDL